MRKLCMLLCMVASVLWVSAQEITVTGKVTNAASKKGLEGLNVQVKGSSKGTTTGANGNFSLSAPSNGTLVFSGVGFTTREISIQGQTNMDVELTESVSELNQVVVTALGIQRKAKSLTYSTQKVDGSALTGVKELNPINSLQGRVAGLQINRSASGAGGSAKVILRGQKSTRDNQPLYVIDGVPMVNYNGAQPTDVWGQSSGSGSGGRDGGDLLSTLNPEDIESINVLKGASASALYGSQAGNGVIMINTKRGKNGTARVDFSSTLFVDDAAYKPEMQNSYLQSSPGNVYSWGAKGNSTEHVNDFFQKGTTFINSIGLSGGNEKAQTYFSYSNTTNKGIIPNTSLQQHTFNFRETAKFLKDKLNVDANILLATQLLHNRPTSGLYYNPLTGLYLFPRGLNFDKYKNFEYFSRTRNTYLQDWWNINHDRGEAGQDNQQNPYWILNRNQTRQQKDNVIGSLALRYLINDWLTIQARGNINKNFDKYGLEAYASTQGTLADFNGRYTTDDIVTQQLYGDVLLTGSPKISENVGLSFNLGSSIQDQRQDRTFIDSKGGDLRFANIFTLGNLNPSNASTYSQNGSRRQIQSVFATTALNFKEWLYLDLSVRNDWSSTLAFTPEKKGGYLYYAAGGNVILSELLSLPKFFNYGKVRLNYAQVGNDVAPFATLPTNGITSGNFQPNTSGAFNNATLKPEITTSFEVGTEWRMWDSRLYADVTYYKASTKNQFFSFGAPLGSGLSTFFVNAGNVQNSGIEATVALDVVKNSKVTWNTSFNYTKNTNKVVELLPELGGSYDLTGAGVNNYSLRIKEGGRFGDIYGRKFQRAADGSIIVDDNGRPQSGDFDFLGNPMPDFMLGWNNQVTFKQFTLSALVDARFGGEVMSITQALLDEYGVSKVTADARNAGGVNIPATKASGGKWNGPLPAEAFYTAVGGRAGITEYYMYDATNIRLREFSLSYRFNMSKTSFAKDLRLSLVGRNLFYFKRVAPFDPEQSMSTGNGLQGVDVFALPATRSFGATLNVSF